MIISYEIESGNKSQKFDIWELFVCEFLRVEFWTIISEFTKTGIKQQKKITSFRKKSQKLLINKYLKIVCESLRGVAEFWTKISEFWKKQE